MVVRVSNGMKRLDVRLPMEDAELAFQMKKIGADAVSPLCKLVGAVDGVNVLGRMEGQAVNMDELNFLAKRIESLTDYEQKVMAAYVEDRGVDRLVDLINLTFSMKGLSLITDFSNAGQVGKRLYLDEFLAMSKSEGEKTDFAAFAEKTLRESRIEVHPYGIFVEHGFEMQEVYEGKTFPEYFYDPDKTVVSVEVRNKAGDSEYLYLPTEICAFNKMKARLQVSRFDECEVTAIHNLRLPERIAPLPEDIRAVDRLTRFNELCQTVDRFDEDKMRQLTMAVEFIGTTEFTDMTFIARNLGDFEIALSVQNDEAYGRFLITESGLFEVDDLLLQYIDYAALAVDKRENTLAASGYVTDGFIGSIREPDEYLQYEGEYADSLESLSDSYETLCLYSPLTANLVVDGEDMGNLYRSDLLQYEEEIAEAIEKDYCVGEEARGLMHYFHQDRAVAGKVLTACPKVQELCGELYGVLECQIREPLTEKEMAILKDYWTGQMSDGWGEGFEQHPIAVDEGEIYVSFWNSAGFWSVMTEAELMEGQAEGMRMT